MALQPGWRRFSPTPKPGEIPEHLVMERTNHEVQTVGGRLQPGPSWKQQAWARDCERNPTKAKAQRGAGQCGGWEEVDTRTRGHFISDSHTGLGGSPSTGGWVQALEPDGSNRQLCDLNVSVQPCRQLLSWAIPACKVGDSVVRHVM